MSERSSGRVVPWASSSREPDDRESRLADFGRDYHEVNGLHASRRRPFLQEFDEFLERRHLALRPDFDAPVVSIAHPTIESESARAHLRVMAESDALHESAHHDVSSFEGHATASVTPGYDRAVLPALLAVASLSISQLAPGPWRAVLASPLGELPFEITVEARGDADVATIRNGAETIERPLELDADGSVRIAFPYFDSVLFARPSADGRELVGVWRKHATDGHEREMAFTARAGAAPRFALAADARVEPERVAGRWSVRFADEAEPAVLILASAGNGTVGTFLTATGDHRYLAGVFQAGRLRLSCFDGAHAFLYDARLEADDTLAGTFASGPAWQRKWTARRDEKAEIPDEFASARWSTEPGLLWIEGVDRDGTSRSLADLLRTARALVVQIAGSWCPNCHDELAWLAPLAVELSDRGLAVVTLGFEAAGDEARALRQLERMRERHSARHAFLLGGTADKARAATALGTIDRVVAFPTLVVLGQDGAPRAVHSGFRGPATGVEHERVVRDLRSRIEAALAEPEVASPALAMFVDEERWRDERDRTFFEVRREGERVLFVEREVFRFDGPTREEPVASGEVVARGDVLWIGDEAWQFDRRAQVALDPRDLAHRLVPMARGPFPRVGDGRVAGMAVDQPSELVAALASADPVLRREAVWFLTNQIVTAMFAPPDYAPIVDAASAVQIVPRLEDVDPLVRATACWAAGALRIEAAIPALRANAEHPFAAVRREASKSLSALQPR